MAAKQGSSGRKMRKKGDWVTIARGRANTERVLINGSGLSNIPRVGDVGSAAYRRLQAKGKSA